MLGMCELLHITANLKNADLRGSPYPNLGTLLWSVSYRYWIAIAKIMPHGRRDPSQVPRFGWD
jgi:hypothetical protein